MDLDFVGINDFARTFKNTTQGWTQLLGTISNVDAKTVSVKVNGQATEVTGVPYVNHFSPYIGQTVILKTNGSDMYVDGALAGNGGVVIAASVQKGTAQTSVADSTTTKVTFDSTALFDTTGLWDSANNEFDIDTTGIYSITATVGFAANSTGQRDVRIRVGATDEFITRGGTGGASASTFITCSGIALLNQGTFVSVYATQYSGGALNFVAGTPVKFSIAYLGSNT